MVVSSLSYSTAAGHCSCLLAGGGRRYQDLDDALDGVSHKVLADILARAERDGLVVHHLDPGRVETSTFR